MHFDVLHEPCIRVERLDGERMLLGISDVLKQAHLLRAVRADTPVEEYALQRLLIAFVSDMYRPRSALDIGEIVEKGCFEPQTVDDYEALCRAEGVTFDLFDEGNPFLQTQGMQEPVVEASRLFLQIPTGNNHAFFTHASQIQTAFTPAECLAGLAAISPYAMMLARSTHYSVMGVPPVYFLYGGRSLFETLAVSMIPSRALGSEALYAQPPVAWRAPAPESAGASPSGISYLSGLTAQPRRVRLLPVQEEGGIVVRTMAYDKGYVYEAADYPDPHAIYVKSKKDGVRRSLKAQESRALWRDIGSMVSAEGSSLAILHNIKDKLPEEPAVVSLRAYALASRQKGATRAPITWWQEELPLRASLLKDRYRAQVYSRCLEDMETIGRMLVSVMQKTPEQMRDPNAPKGKKKGRYAGFAQEVGALYLAASRHFALDLLPVQLEEGDAVEVRTQALRDMAWLAEKTLDGFLNRFARSGDRLQWQICARGALRAMTYKYRKDQNDAQVVKTNG